MEPITTSENVKISWMVFKEIKAGNIIKPKSCSKCGKETKLHGHHEDYSKPFELIWVCAYCHRHFYHSNRPRMVVSDWKKKGKPIEPIPNIFTIFNRNELKTRLDVSTPTILKMEADGLPVMRSGNIIRYDWEDVVEWMKNNHPEEVR